MAAERDRRRARGITKRPGIQHIIVAPERGDIDAWLAGMEIIARVCELGLA